MESKDLKITSLNKFVSEDISRTLTSDVENILIEFKACFKDQTFCDFDLFLGKDSIKIPSHRIVLSASSSYFKEKLLKNEDSNEFKFPDINVQTIRSVVEYMYSGEIEISSSTVENILHIAKVWKMNELQTICFDFLSEELCAENCLGVLLFAERQELFRLGEIALQYACKHFKDISESSEFLLLDEDQLEKLLLSSDILVDSETIIFNSLISWINYDPTNRERSLPKLLPTVRFQSLTPKFIIENRHSVCKTVDCYQIVCSWLEWHLLPQSKIRINIPKPRKFTQVVLATWTNSESLKMDLFYKKQKEIPKMKMNKERFSVLNVNKKLFVVGGEIGNKTTNSVECFDFATEKWSDLPPIKISRSRFQMAELNGEIYAIGGWTDNGTGNGTKISSVEKYNVSTSKWEDVAELPFKDYSRVAVLNGCIYALNYTSTSVYRYDPSNDKWAAIASTNSKCNLIAADENYLYAVGGKSTERYNTSNDKWIYVKNHDIQGAIGCLGLGPRKTRIIAVGVNGSVREYIPEEDVWIYSPPCKTFLGKNSQLCYF